MANQVSAFPLPLVFKAILAKKGSGELDIHGPDFKKKLFFIGGKLVGATSTLEAERLGSLLVCKSIIPSESLQRLEGARGRGGEEKIGRQLVQSGLLTEQQLYDCLAGQCRAIAANTFGLDLGEWSFSPGTPSIPGGQRFQIHLQPVIIEGIKEIRDFSFYRKLLENSRLRVGNLPEKTGRLLPEFSREFFRKISRFSGRPAGDVGRQIDLAENVYWREVVLFYLLNVFSFAKADTALADTATAIAAQVSPQRLAPGRPASESRAGGGKRGKTGGFQSPAAASALKEKTRPPAPEDEEVFELPQSAVKSEPEARKREKTRPPEARASGQPNASDDEIFELPPSAEKKDEESSKREKTRPPIPVTEYSSPFTDESVIDLPVGPEDKKSISDILKTTPPTRTKKDKDSISDIFLVTPIPGPGEPPAVKADSGAAPASVHTIPLELEVEMGPISPSEGKEENAAAREPERERAEPPLIIPRSDGREFGIPREFEVDMEPYNAEKEARAPTSAKQENGTPPLRIPTTPKREFGIPDEFEMEIVSAAAGKTASDAEDQYRKALLLRGEKKYREAASILVKIVEPGTAPADHLFLLGLCFAKLPDFQKEAEMYLKLAVEKEPGSADPILALAEFYKSQGKLAQAEAAYRRIFDSGQNRQAAKPAPAGPKKRKPSSR